MQLLMIKIILIALISFAGCHENTLKSITENIAVKAESDIVKQHMSAQSDKQVASSSSGANLEARNDRNFIKDIVDRLQALDADIGKLLYNSTSMYAPDDKASAFKENQPKGGERFTEVLADLDSLQDEIGSLVTNATRTRQYNIIVRLRPLNTILYRIRHNLHLIRNSLVAVNTVASLERLGNSVLDSTLQAFLKPDASEEIGDDGNYEIDLNKPAGIETADSNSLTTAKSELSSRPPHGNINSSITNQTPANTSQLRATPSITTPTTTTTTTTTSTTTTPKPTAASTSVRRPTRAPSRRGGSRPNQRRRDSLAPTSTSTLYPGTSS